MTDKQLIFIERYLVHFNATKAALEAGYSDNTAYSIGQENLNKPEIKKIKDERIKEIIAKTDDKRSMLINFWVGVIENPESSERAKQQASDSLGKYLAMFTERVELTGKDEKPIEIKWI